MLFRIILLGIAVLLRYTALRYPAFRKRLAERNFTAQIKTWDDSVGRHFTFEDGKVTSARGIHPDPDICLSFKTAKLAASLLLPPINWLDQINAIKDFNLMRER